MSLDEDTIFPSQHCRASALYDARGRTSLSLSFRNDVQQSLEENRSPTNHAWELGSRGRSRGDPFASLRTGFPFDKLRCSCPMPLTGKTLVAECIQSATTDRPSE